MSTHLSARNHRSEDVQQADADLGEQVLLFQLKVVWKGGKCRQNYLSKGRPKLTIDERNNLDIQLRHPIAELCIVDVVAFQEIPPRQIGIVQNFYKITKGLYKIQLAGQCGARVDQLLKNHVRHRNAIGQVARLDHRVDVVKVPRYYCQTFQQQRRIAELLLVQSAGRVGRVASNDQEFLNRWQQLFGQPVQIGPIVRLDRFPVPGIVQVQVDLLLPDFDEAADELSEVAFVVLECGV
jgi:hypothetical protein